MTSPIDDFSDWVIIPNHDTGISEPTLVKDATYYAKCKVLMDRIQKESDLSGVFSRDFSKQNIEMILQVTNDPNSMGYVVDQSHIDDVIGALFEILRREPLFSCRELSILYSKWLALENMSREEIWELLTKEMSPGKIDTLYQFVTLLQ